MSTQVQEPSRCNTPVQSGCPARQERVFEPLANIYRTAEAIYLEAELPGVDAANLSINLENDTMVIGGTTQASEHDPGELKYAEWAPGRYQRSFKIGPQVDRDAISADMKNGLLKLKLPLKEAEKPRKIQINIEN